MKGKEIAIFDFDGTIVSKNTGSEFYKWQARRSILRVITLTLLLPILIPLRIIAFLTNDPYTQKIGLNIVCFASTCFPQGSLLKLRRNFIDYYFSQCGAITHMDALEHIKMHQRQGHQVIIISGCPHWLLHGIAKHIGIKGAILIGSKVSYSWKGLLLSRHCHQKNKIIMARDHGIELQRCHFGYSDSTSDIALLRYCKNVIMVNTNFIERAILHLLLHKEFSCKRWK